MKNQFTKKLITFIVAAMIFSATTNAQSELANPKTQIQPKPEAQSQPQEKLKSTTPCPLLATTPHCYCNVLG